MSNAAEFYTVEVAKKPLFARIRAYVVFSFGALISMGDPGSAVLVTNEVVVRDLSGKVVSRIGESWADNEPMIQVVQRDLERMSATEFASEWGINA